MLAALLAPASVCWLDPDLLLAPGVMKECKLVCEEFISRDKVRDSGQVKADCVSEEKKNYGCGTVRMKPSLECWPTSVQNK